MAAQQFSRQEVVELLRRTGYPEAAEEALRVLPDPVDLHTLLQFGKPYGISRGVLVDRMGGSP